MREMMLVATVFCLCLVTELEGRVLYSFQKHTNKSNNTTHYNDVTKWDLKGDRARAGGGVRTRLEVADMPSLPLDEDDMLAVLQSVNHQLSALRTSMANLKYQNHLIYKQFKRYNNRCMAGSGPLGVSESLRACPDDYTWNPQLRKCYKFANDRITWRMAREKCRAGGADLVSIESQREQRFIQETARTTKEMRHCDFWTGASDSNHDKEWRWVATKASLSYTNWNHNEPNNGNGDEHCMHMLWVFGWMWNDARCNYDSSCYICEIRRQ